MLEGCRHNGVEHLVYASSSSVYGANTKMPFSVHHNVDHPLSLYAATKKANELMAHTYATSTGCRRPGCASSPSTARGAGRTWRCSCSPKAILAGKPIDVFNHGKQRRDFTYVDDIVEGVVRAMRPRRRSRTRPGTATAPDPATSNAPYRIYNIGNNQPVELLRYIEVLEDCLGRKAEKNLLPMQPGDVPETYADVEDLTRDVGFTPGDAGRGRRRGAFVDWYREYYKDGEPANPKVVNLG